MLKLLIVDDEMFAVKAIRSGVEWPDLDIAVIYEANTVKQAMKVFEDDPPDIMICDIEMPGANGLALLEWVKRHHPATETIFLTCHADFAYAHKAIHLGSFDYLLKPVNYDELKQVAAKAALKLKRDRETEHYMEVYRKYRQLWEEQKPMLIERFWQDILDHWQQPTPEHLERAEAIYGLPIKPDRAVLPILISVEEWHKELDMKDEEIMHYALRNAASELILEGREGAVFRDRNGGNAVLIYETDGRTPDRETLRASCQRFVEACAEYFFCSLSCYAGEWCALPRLAQDYMRLASLAGRNVTRSGAVIFLDCEEHGSVVKPQRIPVADWTVLFEMGKQDALLRKIDDYLSAMEANGSITSESLTALHHALLNMVYHAFHDKGLSVRGLLNDKDMTEAAAATRSFALFRKWAARILADATRILAESGADQSAIVEKIKEFVADHIETDFSREDIAAHVYLNSDYVSRLFKKETGQSLLGYIMHEKIERAKQLLRTSNLKISEIGETLGYYNIPYFTNFFKKSVGITPHEYRKKYQ